MPRDSLYQPVDHFLQADIIAKLAAADRPLRFSELKESSIENSLFMYHANRLIDRGLIEKKEVGFNLTLKGARWANYVDIQYDLTPIAPRPLVQFIIEDSAGNILMAVRKGSLKQRLNDYLLPGNVYRHGMTLADNVEAIHKELFREDSVCTAKPLTTADVIHRANDGHVSHVIVYIFRIQTNSEKTQVLSHPLFATKWVAKHDINRNNPTYKRSEFLPLLFERLPSVSAHETFLIDI